MGKRTSALSGARSILDIHEEYGGKASRIVRRDDTLNYERAKTSSAKLARNLTNDVRTSINDSTNSTIESTISRLDSQLKEQIGVGLSDSQKASIMSRAKKQASGSFRGLTLNQRLNNSRNIVQQRMTQYTSQGMVEGQQGKNMLAARRFIDTPSSQGLIAGGSIVNRNQRLAISEVQRAKQNTVTAFLREEDMPGRWTLSPRHHKRDICDEHAENTGAKFAKMIAQYGISVDEHGCYMPTEIPAYPHPYCECDIEPVFTDLGMATVTRKQVFENIGQELTDKDVMELDSLGSEYYQQWKESEIRYGGSIASERMTAKEKAEAIARMEKRLKSGLSDGIIVKDSALNTAIRNGGYRAYSGIAQDLGLSALPKEVVDEIGVDNAVRLLADDIKKKGVAQDALTALRRSLETDVQSALRTSQRKATAELKEIEAVKKAFLDGDISKRSAQRQRSLLLKSAREELGDAVGYSRTTQTLIDELEKEGSREYLAISIRSKSQASRIAKDLGLDKKTYKVMQNNKKLVLNEEGISALKAFGEQGESLTISAKANRIRTGKTSESWLAHGLKTSYIDPKTGEEKVLKMLPAQQRGAKFIAEQQNALINYQVGSGKTLTSIGGVGELVEKGRAKKVLYVTMNNGLAGQYADEVATFSNLTCTTVKGAKFDYANTDSLITAISKNQLVRDFDKIKAAGYDTVIIDEAHTFMQPIGAEKLVPMDLVRSLQGAKTKVAMTGTPITEKIDDLYGIAKWLNPEAVGSKASFTRKFSNFGSLSTVATKQAERELKSIVDPFLISAEGKRKGKLIEKTIQVALTSEDKSYLAKLTKNLDAAVARGEISRSRASATLRGQQNALINGKSTAKVKALQKLLDKADGKTVIHVQSSRARTQIIEALGENSGVYVAKTGGAKGREMINAFRADPDAKILIAGSQLNTGINLDFADTAIIYDRPDSAYILEQLQARTHRGLKATDTQQYFLMTQTDYDRELTRYIESTRKETKVLDKLGKVSDSELKRIFRKLLGGK